MSNLEQQVHELVQRLRQLQEENRRLAGVIQEKERLLDEQRSELTRLQVLANNAPVGLVMTDELGNYLFTNPEAEATVYGNVTGNAYCPQGGYTLHYPDGTLIPQEELPMVQALQKGEIVKDFWMVVRMEDGRETDVLVNAAPVKNNEARICGSVTVLENITARRKAEKVQEHLLSESNQQRVFLEKLISEVPVAISVYQGPDHRIILENPMQRQVTRGKGDVLWRTAAEVWGDSQEQYLLMLDRVYQTGEPHCARDVPCQVTRDKGPEQAFFNVSFSPLFNEKGQVDGIMALGVETTEEVKIRKQVEKERARLEAVLEALPVGVWIADQKGRLIGKNREADRIVGGDTPFADSIDEYSQYVAVYAGRGETLLPEEFPMAKALKTGQPVEPIELSIRRIDGTVGTVLASAAPIKDKDGLPIGSVGITVDITERKQIEEARLLEQKFLRMVIDLTPNLIFVKDQDGRYVLVNKLFTQAYGKSMEEIQGKTDAELTPHKEEVAHFRQDDLEVINSRKEKFISEEELTHSDGSIHWYSTVKVPLFNLDGVCDRVLGVATDITSYRLAENALKEYAQKLERSNDELEQFAFVASHDLQEPLRKVKVFGERLSRQLGDQIGDEERNFLARMQSASQRMQDMIDALLELSRVNTYGRPFVPVDLNEVAEIVLSDLENRIAAAGATVTIGRLPILAADPVQMQQLFQNLLGNSIKYCRPGISPVITVTGEIIEERGRPAELLITFVDNGIGFDDQYTDRIFQPFQRLVGHSEFEGSGMGLAICKKIVERHGGNITARSKRGQGSIFTVRLPYQERKAPYSNQR